VPQVSWVDGSGADAFLIKIPSSCVLLCELKEEEGEPMETHPTSEITHAV